MKIVKNFWLARQKVKKHASSNFTFVLQDKPMFSQHTKHQSLSNLKFKPYRERVNTNLHQPK